MEVYENLDNIEDDLIHQSDKQFTINTVLSKRIQELEMTATKIINKVSLLKYEHDFFSKCYEVLFGFKMLIDFTDDLLKGAIQVSNGIPAMPFIEPKMLADIMETYEQDIRFEKPYFSARNIPDIYSIMEPTLFTADNRIAVVSKIQIPTRSSIGRVYQLRKFPIYDNSTDSFVTLKHSDNQNFLVVNRYSMFFVMSSAEVNACKKEQTITICNAHEKIWKQANHPTCISALYFEQKKAVGELCNFDIQRATDEILKPTHLDNGYYHFALQKPTNIFIYCNDGETQIKNLEKNGVLGLGKHCTAYLGSYLIANRGLYRPFNFESVQSGIFYNFTKMAIQKMKHELEKKINQPKILLDDKTISKYFEQREMNKKIQSLMKEGADQETKLKSIWMKAKV